MTEAQQFSDLLDTPCQFCDAGVGEPCDDNCEALMQNWPGNEPKPSVYDYDGDAWIREETDPAKSAMMKPLYQLPFVGSFLQPPNYRGRSTEEWLSELGAWFEDYNAFAKQRIGKLEDSARQALSLRLERDVVRRFLLGEPPGSEDE